MRPVEICVEADGSLNFVHDDRVTGAVAALGDLRIQRASHVEADAAGCWWADLAPVGGPKLGPYPPGQRHQALADEVAWLHRQLRVQPLFPLE